MRFLGPTPNSLTHKVWEGAWEFAFLISSGNSFFFFFFSSGNSDAAGPCITFYLALEKIHIRISWGDLKIPMFSIKYQNLLG